MPHPTSSSPILTPTPHPTTFMAAAPSNTPLLQSSPSLDLPARGSCWCPENHGPSIQLNAFIQVPATQVSVPGKREDGATHKQF